MLFFFFKQKTAYEMRISDWSSDVCSSDLPQRRALDTFVGARLARYEDNAACEKARCLHRGQALLPQIKPSPQGFVLGRSEERRVGKECVSTCRSRWSPYH